MWMGSGFKKSFFCLFFIFLNHACLLAALLQSPMFLLISFGTWQCSCLTMFKSLRCIPDVFGDERSSNTCDFQSLVSFLLCRWVDFGPGISWQTKKRYRVRRNLNSKRSTSVKPAADWACTTAALQVCLNRKSTVCNQILTRFWSLTCVVQSLETDINQLEHISERKISSARLCVQKNVFKVFGKKSSVLTNDH